MKGTAPLIGLTIGCYHDLVNKEIFAQENIDYDTRTTEFSNNYLNKIANPYLYKKDGEGNIPRISHHIYVSVSESRIMLNKVSIEKTILTINRLNDLGYNWQHFIWVNNPDTVPDNIKTLKNVFLKDIKEFEDHILYKNVLTLCNKAQEDARELSGASDIIRYLALHKFGGAYFDLDYHLLDAKKLDELMQIYNLIAGKEPKELSNYIGNSFIAVKPAHAVVKTAIQLIGRNLNGNSTLLPEYLRYPCSLFSKRMYNTGPALFTIAFYQSANASNNDLLALDGRIFFNKKYIDYITPNTSCYNPDVPVNPINYIDGTEINTIGADTWCNAWPVEYFTCIYYADLRDAYLYSATIGSDLELMRLYIAEGADANYVYKNDTALALAVRNQNIAAMKLLISNGAVVDNTVKQLANNTGNYTIVRSLSTLSKLDEIGCYANHSKEIFMQEGFDLLEEDRKLTAHYSLFAPKKFMQSDRPFQIPTRMVKIYVTSVTDPKPIDSISLNKTINTLTRLYQEDNSWQFDFFTNNVNIVPDEIAGLPGVRVRRDIELRFIDPLFWDSTMVKVLLQAESEQYFYAKYSDMLRIMALIEKGGFYQDLDGEVYRPEAFDALRKYNFVGGKELDYQLTSIGNAFFGASANHSIIRGTFELIKRNLLTDRNLLPEYLQFPCNIGCKIIFEVGSPTLTTSYFKYANQNGNLDIIFPAKVFFNRDYARYLTPESRCHDPGAKASLDNIVNGETIESIAGDPFCGSWGIGALQPIYYHENQNYHLYEAANLGNIELLEQAIANKADVNQPYFKNGITPLNIASYNGHYHIVKTLLEAGADTEIKNDGSTALMWAITNKHTDIVNLLLDYNANINVTRPNNVSALFLASYIRSPEIVNLLLTRDASTDNLFQGETAESYAQKNNFTEIVQIFANHKALSPEISLNMAAATGDYTKVKQLLDSGVNKDVIIGKFTALQTAAYFEQEEIVDLLLSYGAEIISEGEFSALNIAQLKQNYTTKGKIIHHKVLASYLNSSVFDSKQFVIARYNEPLEWTLKELINEDVIIYNKGPDNLDYLPSHFKVIKIANQGREAHTYFYHIITNYDNLASRTIFLQGDPYDHPLILPLKRFKDEEPLGCKNIIAKCTSMHPTLFTKSLDLEEQLRSKYQNLTVRSTLIEFVHSNIDPFYDVNETLFMVNGAQFGVERKNILNHPVSFYKKLISFLNGLNPLEGYYFERLWDLVFDPEVNPIKKITHKLLEAISERQPSYIIQNWLSWDIDVNQTKDGLNALHFASLTNYTDVIPWLILKGIDVDSVIENNGMTALHICAKYNFLESCKILINSGADVNHQLSNGYTPLHQAIFGNYTEMVALLIANDAAVVNDRFMNPLELAARLENDNVHNMLLMQYHKNLRALDLKNQLDCPVQNISIVVVTVNEDIEWIADEFPCHDVTLYNKGSRNLTDTPYYKVIKVDNSGYFEGTTIKHIVEHYHDLAPRTLFLQGNPYDAYIFPYFYRLAGDVSSTCHNIICKCDTAPHNLQAESIALQKADWVTLINGKYKHFNYQNNNHSLEEFAQKYLDTHIPFLFPICYASQYAVERDVVHRHPLDYYQNLSESINYRQFPIEAFYFERLNDLIYGQPSCFDNKIISFT